MKKHTGYIYIILCALIFSTMEVMLKTVSGVFAPMQITVIRFLAGGVLLIPFAVRSLRRRGRRLTVKDAGFFLLEGFLCVPVSMVLYQMAVTYTKASVVAVVFSCNPIFVALLAWFMLREPFRKNHAAALVLEAAGIVAIVDPFHGQLNMTGVSLAILAALAFSLYGVAGKRKTPEYGGIAVTCLCFLCGGLELLLVLLLGRTAAGGRLFSSLGLDIFVDVPLLAGIPLSALPSLLYICAINSAAGYVCHMMAMEKTSAKEASLVFFLKPMIAPLIAMALLGEDIPWNMVLGIALFMAGSAVFIIPDLKREKKHP